MFSTKSFDVLNASWHAAHPSYMVLCKFEEGLEGFDGDLTNSTEFARMAEQVLNDQLLKETLLNLKQNLATLNRLASFIET